ncbi:hypothetical protein CsSME_00039816 [Camellia sinensis var. sinensis]
MCLVNLSWCSRFKSLFYTCFWFSLPCKLQRLQSRAGYVLSVLNFQFGWVVIWLQQTSSIYYHLCKKITIKKGQPSATVNETPTTTGSKKGWMYVVLSPHAERFYSHENKKYNAWKKKSNTIRARISYTISKAFYFLDMIV